LGDVATYLVQHGIVERAAVEVYVTALSLDQSNLLTETGAATASSDSQADMPRPPRPHIKKHQLFLHQLPEAIGRNQVKKALKEAFCKRLHFNIFLSFKKLIPFFLF